VVTLVSGSTIFLKEMLKKEGLGLNRDYTIVQGRLNHLTFTPKTGQFLALANRLI